jgi:hypothetical protein
MTPPTKVHRMIDLTSLTNLVSSWISYHCPSGGVEQTIRTMLADRRLSVLAGTRKAIRDQLQRDPQHLQNLYITWDGTSSKATATYTFGDKDTALLFKLSLV